MCVCECEKLQELRIVVQHLFKMRYQPDRIRRVARVGAAEMVVDSALRHAIEHQMQSVLSLGRAGTERVLPKEAEDGRVGEFWSAAQPALLRIVQSQQGGGERIEMDRCWQIAG